MSGGKKRFKPKRTYTEGEVRHAIREASDGAVKRIMLLCLLASRDEFDLDGDGTVEFMQRMQRYIQYEKEGTINLTDASKSLKEHTGIDLQLRRW